MPVLSPGAGPAPAAASLAEFKAHLNITDTTQDVEVQAMLDAATGVAEGVVGPIVERGVTSRVDFPGGALALPAYPVVSVESVSSVRRDAVYPETDLEVDATAGMVRLTGGSGLPADMYDVTYTVGRAATTDDVPAALKLAVLVIGKHMWETQRGRTARPGILGHNSGVEDERPLMGFALPNRALQLLQPYRQLTVA